MYKKLNLSKSFDILILHGKKFELERREDAMLSELLIENYRGIKNLDLGTLGKINIIAGANNTGKTSILEVIRSL